MLQSAEYATIKRGRFQIGIVRRGATMIVRTCSTWFTAFLLLAVFFSMPAEAHKWDAKRAQLYTLGVELGFASVHSVAAANASNIDEIRAMRALVVVDMLAIQPIAASIAQNGGPKMAPIDTSYLQFLASNAITIAEAHNDFGTISASVVASRDGLTATLSKASPVATNAYVLGVNMGIAEAQATVGESARPIVFDSLRNALDAAKALGLDTSALEQCLNQTHISMPELHTLIQSARTTYQNLL